MNWTWKPTSEEVWPSDPLKETWVLQIILGLIWRANLIFLSSKLIIGNPSSWLPHFRFGIQKICHLIITLGHALPVGSLVELIATALYCNFWFFMLHQISSACSRVHKLSTETWSHWAAHVSINRIIFISKSLVGARIFLNISWFLP